MNLTKCISRVVQELKNTQIVEKLCVNDDETAYDNVYICTKKGDKKRYVCKSIKNGLFNPLEFAVPILMINNPHFLKVKNFVYNVNGETFFIMDFIEDGDLFEIKNEERLDETTCRNIIFTLVNALHDLHKKNVIHNDVKLENILFDKRHKKVFICDYGLARIIDTPSIYDGTSVYFSPEKIKNQPYAPSFDWWAVGIVCYEILSSSYPYPIDDEKEIDPPDMLPFYSKSLKQIKGVSKKAMDFVSRMLTLDINNRLSSYNEIIKHPFLRM
ncbi:protein kinase-1 [Diatraea saccharalis granulovirus]|uniref:Protein kinase-1 n=1 Tax=Diatraea saccharalis granulovirus TaxID=1675862 RepID=A0A0R7EYN9_9BBAC|nr:protein kinase-1 [Diatraea saccharalis granulovirus]AKN80702.1 protein kinase-1 [Diatraea saccharalis granulovirus]